MYLVIVLIITNVCIYKRTLESHILYPTHIFGESNTNPPNGEFCMDNPLLLFKGEGVGKSDQTCDIGFQKEDPR